MNTNERTSAEIEYADATQFFQSLRKSARHPDLADSKVVYVDQGALSSLALGAMPDVAQAVESLRADGRIVCPLSEYHRDESAALQGSHGGADARDTGEPTHSRFLRVYGYAINLSGGWFVQSYWGVLAFEILAGFQRYLERGGPSRVPIRWVDCPISRTPDWSPETPRLRSNDALVEQLQSNLPKAPPNDPDFYMRSEMSGADVKYQLDFAFGTHPRSGEIGPWYPGHRHLRRICATAAQIAGPSNARRFVEDFFGSAYYRLAPSTLLEASFYAGRRRTEARKWRHSDAVDAHVASTILPYVDAIVVDGGVADIFRRGYVKCGELFPDVEVVASRKEDLSAFFSRLRS